MLSNQAEQQILAEVSGTACVLSGMPGTFSEVLYAIQDSLTAPRILMKPTLSPDGDMWCAMYGEDPVQGVVGFGETPAQAMAAFDEEWRTGLTHKAAFAKKQALASPTKGETT